MKHIKVEYEVGINALNRMKSPNSIYRILTHSNKKYGLSKARKFFKSNFNSVYFRHDLIGDSIRFSFYFQPQQEVTHTVIRQLKVRFLFVSYTRNIHITLVDGRDELFLRYPKLFHQRKI
jgi:hypothetical protein